MRDNCFFKGMGSAYGGEWRPNPSKPNDERFLGEPGETKIVLNRQGEKIETKIGADGKADKERHYSDHHTPNRHTNPHDHEIDWSSGYPHPGKPINYPDGAPELKQHRKGGNINMEVNIDFLDDSLNFNTISAFKRCMKSGGEVEFMWNSKQYCAFGNLQKLDTSKEQMCICEAYKPETEFWCNTVDEMLEYMVAGDKLRDVITKIKVIDRTI